jgi:hypothetical protein
MRALTFGGILSGEGFELMPGFIVDYDAPDTAADDGGKDGMIVVEALAKGGKPLATTRLPLGEPCAYPAADGKRRGGAARLAVGCVAFPEDARGIRVSVEGRILFEREEKAEKDFQPKVRWPKALEKVRVSVEWDGEGDDLAAVLGYSGDGGRTWQPLSLPSSNRTIQFDTDDLPGSDSGQLQLRVSDGLRSVEVLSDTYRVPPRNWRLWVLAPAAGTSHPEDRPVQLQAQAWHMEKGQPGFDGISWASSIDGALGEGAAIQTMLSPGSHVLTVTRGDLSAETRLVVVAAT